MKILNLAILLFAVSINQSFSQKATLTFRTDKEVDVSICAPIDNAFNPYYAKDVLNLKPNMAVLYDIAVKDFSEVQLVYSDGFRKKLILLPNENIECIYTNEDINFNGESAEVQLYLNNTIKWGSYSSVLDSIVGKKVIDRVDFTVIDKNLKDKAFNKPYIDLKKRKFSKTYNEILSKEIKYLQIASIQIFYESLLRGLVNKVKPTSKDSTEIFKRIFAMYDDSTVINHSTLKFNGYHPGYYEIYRWNSLDSKKRASLRGNFSSKSLGPLIRTFLAQPSYMQPILIGKCFLVELSENMNTFDHDYVLDFMKIKFPESEYIPIITKLLEEKKSRNNAPKQSFATIIDGSNISSLKDLTQTSSLKGKKLFIDLWETNCSPCKYEFQFNKKLHDILNKYDNIVKVYISLDNEKNDSIWRDMIGFYKLDSYNIRANNNLSKDIKEKIYNGGSMMVPRFVLLDSDSQLLGNRLPNPSKGNLLENALDKILNQ